MTTFHLPDPATGVVLAVSVDAFRGACGHCEYRERRPGSVFCDACSRSHGGTLTADEEARLTPRPLARKPYPGQAPNPFRSPIGSDDHAALVHAARLNAPEVRP